MNPTCDMANAILAVLGIPATLVRRVELTLDVNHPPLLRIERYVLGDKVDPFHKATEIADMADREWRKYTTRSVEVREESFEIIERREEDGAHGSQ